MRYLIISDVHSNMSALREVRDRTSEINIAGIICAGDIVGYNASPNQVVQYLRKHSTIAVKGNHDEAVLTETPTEFNITAKRATDWTRRELSEDNEHYLRELPLEVNYGLDRLNIYMCHGSPTDNLRQYVYEDDITEKRISQWFPKAPDVIILGHTHRQFMKYVGETLILNPGSVGQPRDGDSRAAYAILNTATNSVELCRAEYDIDKTAKKVNAVLPRKISDRLYSGE